jgi:hypothetical protein
MLSDNFCERFYLLSQGLLANFQDKSSNTDSDSHTLAFRSLRLYSDAIFNSKNDLLDAFPKNNPEDNKLDNFNKEKLKSSLEKLEQVLQEGLKLCELLEIIIQEKNITDSNSNIKNH